MPNLIADMNSQNSSSRVHDGDLKAGNGPPGRTRRDVPADDALYTQALGYFNALEQPAMFTPGDNDWTDCDRPSNGGFNSLERLDHERQVFFCTPTARSAQHTMQQEVQSTPSCLGMTARRVSRGPDGRASRTAAGRSRT